MKTRFLAAALAAAAMVTAGCKDSTGDDGDDVASGSIAFSHSGARSGSYAANGALRKAGPSSFEKRPFAAGVELSDFGQTLIGIVGYVPVTSSTGNEVVFLLPAVAAGTTLDLSDGCVLETCPLALITFDTNPDLDEDDSEGFLFGGGTIHVTSVSSGRIQGTFSGTASTFAGDRAITVTGGTFDVPVLDESSFPSASRSAPTARLQRLRQRKN
jgi:predicted small secreted protein